uniref:Uncharacterized protein n=1 Tax=Oxyrrhis marina TaxID=2969 RepID=A0A7S3XJA4_OXYMA
MGGRDDEEEEEEEEEEAEEEEDDELPALPSVADCASKVVEAFYKSSDDMRTYLDKGVSPTVESALNELAAVRPDKGKTAKFLSDHIKSGSSKVASSTDEAIGSMPIRRYMRTMAEPVLIPALTEVAFKQPKDSTSALATAIAKRSA